MNEAVRDAQQVQRQAADPTRSRVLEASAGSGKTKVLVDRFLRLCLSGPGVDPRAVLAITFTRKATVEVVERLQREAIRLAGLPRPERRRVLHGILDREPTEAELDRAAWFHESLLDDPAGLGIDTLHAFCQKVLARFAAEVGLDPRFTVLDERQEIDERAAALDALELELGRDPRWSGRYVELGGTPRAARDLVAGVFRQRVHLQRWLDRVAPPEGPAAATLARPLAPHAPALAQDLRRAALAGTPWHDCENPEPADLAPALIQALAEFAGAGLAGVTMAEDAGGDVTPGFARKRDVMRDGALAAVDELRTDASQVPAVLDGLDSWLLTRSGTVARIPGRKPSAEARYAALCAAAAPILQFRQLLELDQLLQRNFTRLECGLRALDLYAGRKRRDRVVDFQDLEYLALRLLTDPEVGPQIHFRLDARLDHLLLDEFQDTNRNQWELLLPLLEELLAGGEVVRTVFVVGDVKQSIYGFRGADPTVFELARQLITRQAGPNAARRLPTNFRTLPRLVQAVGDICEASPVCDHLGAPARHARQAAARTVWPGEVHLVPPFDPDPESSGHDRAAAAVVDIIQDLARREPDTWDWDPAAGADRPRPLDLGDILILARSKTHLATYEAALRRAGIPFTPAGRGLLARNREVQDVLALLRWLSVAADDTAAATVLRSPLVRLDEATVQDLLQRRLAGPRRRNLREVLEQDGAGLEMTALIDQLGGWFRAAGLLPLHDLLRRIYREAEVLARMEIAGGEQARYNLLRLLDLALAADERGGSLRDFVHELEQADKLGGEDEGALPGEAGGGRVRVMTIHGSKGLEAPVVILADAAVPLNSRTDHLLLAGHEDDGPWLSGAPAALVDPGDDGAAGLLAVHGQRALARRQAEEAHILYVALTRARDRLYVLGGRNNRQGAAGDERSYLGWLAQAAPAELWTGRVDLPAPASAAEAQTDDGRLLEARARRLARRQSVWTPPVLAPLMVMETPSTLEPQTPAGPGEDHPRPASPRRRETEATLRGTRVHRWLERAALLGAMPPPPSDPELRMEWDEARATFEHADLTWVFQAGEGLCEVPVIGPGSAADRRIFGIIDRLVIRPDRVDIVDYKSNRVTAAELAGLVDHYRPQLTAYRQVLASLYPGRELRCWLLWTRLAAAGQSDCLSEVLP